VAALRTDSTPARLAELLAAVARLFASHGIDVVLDHRKKVKAEAAAAAIRAVARDADVTIASSAADAVEGQDLVVLTTLWDAPQRAVITELGDALVGKVLLDVSNPLGVTPARDRVH
jgi:predicted dinucleotide-binding enzyme